MRFSVIVPTRNGGSHLRPVLMSVLRQSFEDFELVVADNANTDETPLILAELSSDLRLEVVRSETALSVTENWLSALRAASGEYLLLLGDDDYLMPRFFERMNGILVRHGDPDCVTFNAFTYVAPGGVDASGMAYSASQHFRFTGNLAVEHEMSAAERLQIVRDMFRFRVRFPLNMQLTIFARRMVDRVPRPFFRAPFPDHFALNSLLVLAERFVVVPASLLIVGVSSKSFGHFFYSGRQAEGMRYLGSTSEFDGRLEGSELLNSMYVWLDELRRAYPRQLAGVQVSRWNYAARQVYAWYRELEAGYLSRANFGRRVLSLKRPELLTVFLPITAYRAFRWSLARMRRRQSRIDDFWSGLTPMPDARSIADFAASVARDAAE